ncbi:hypothetical protein FM114_12500 [Luteococcus japonicus LSP_Lj1]|uniref:Uncharacterized protein n=1 Tax=Luteococcus japonicus LSP_Lj1 TaxID=1255658 RepID=A0A1R4K9Y3_9ACTN|nr:hypothetical protein FM114_12500 [Luteococcus japonicus LSP_Lj1]
MRHARPPEKGGCTGNLGVHAPVESPSSMTALTPPDEAHSNLQYA